MIIILEILIKAIGILIALSIHEAAHAWVAYKLGDHTAKNNGRVTLNPLKHLDPLGTILFIVAGIGWGKPVPIDPRNFKNPIRDNALTALAGPASNIGVVLITAIIILLAVLLGITNPILIALLQYTMSINIVLCFFNLIPLPPLDGSKIILPLIPQKYRYQYYKFANQSLSYVLIFFLIDAYIIQDLIGFSIVGKYIETTAQWTLALISKLIGLPLI